MKESPIPAEDEELRKILEKLTFAYKLDDSLWAFDPKELLSVIQSYAQKKYQEGELKGKIGILKHLIAQDRYTNRDSYATKLISDLEAQLTNNNTLDKEI